MSRAHPVNRARGEILSRILFSYIFEVAFIWEAGQPGLPESRLSEARSRLPRFIYEY